MSDDWLRSGKSRPDPSKMAEGKSKRPTVGTELSTGGDTLGDAPVYGESGLSVGKSGIDSELGKGIARASEGSTDLGKSVGKDERRPSFGHDSDGERGIREEYEHAQADLVSKMMRAQTEMISEMMRAQAEREREERERERAAQAERERAQNELMRDMMAQLHRPRDPMQECFKVRLEPLDDKDDVDLYLEQFERIATLHGWPKKVWAVRLMPCLRGQARDCVQRLSLDDAADYDAIKNALMVRFRKTSEYYRKQFRSYRKDEKESFAQAVTRMESFATKWCAMEKCDVTDVDAVWDLFMREAAYRLLPPEVEVKVREREPSSVTDLARAADVIQQAKGSSKGSRPPQPRQEPSKEKPASDDKDSSEVKCFHCKRAGHIKRDCPKLKSMNVVISCDGSEDMRLCTSERERDFDPVTTARVNGETVSALRDTGAGAVIVADRLVAEGDWTGGSVQVRLADAGITQRLRTLVS